jgi:hypothetical protein
MIVEPLTMEISAEDFSEAAGMRSPGLHLSQILQALDEVRNAGARYPETDHATRQAYFSAGFFWEQFISSVFRDTAIKKANGVLIRPGEVVRDGIAMSPDAIDCSDYTLEEYKATYLSSSHPIEDARFWLWIKQMMCYAYAVGTRRARLRVWFIVGDWKGSGPQVRAWTFHFSDRDCEESWQMVLNMAHSKGWL